MIQKEEDSEPTDIGQEAFDALKQKLAELRQKHERLTLQIEETNREIEEYKLKSTQLHKK